MAIRDLMVEYGLPVALSLAVATAGITLTNQRDVAVLQSETENMVEVQKELIKEVKELNRVIYRVDATLAAQYGVRNE